MLKKKTKKTKTKNNADEKEEEESFEDDKEEIQEKKTRRRGTRRRRRTVVDSDENHAIGRTVRIQVRGGGFARVGDIMDAPIRIAKLERQTAQALAGSGENVVEFTDTFERKNHAETLFSKREDSPKWFWIKC